MTIEQTVEVGAPADVPVKARGKPRGAALLLTVFLLTAASVVVNVRWLETHKSDNRLFTNWLMSQFWLTYQHGFTRRGLPGQVLSTIVGATPMYSQVREFGLLLSAAAALAVTGLALSLIRLRQPTTILAAMLVLTSPFAVPLVVHDVLRYDGVGMVVLFLLANGFIWRRITSRWMTELAVGALMLVAAASEEFLAAYLLPVALIRLHLTLRGDADGIRRRAWLRPRTGEWRAVLLTLGPAAALLIASEVLRPSQQVTSAAIQGASANGVLSGTPGEYSALSVLSNGLHQEIHLVLSLGVGKLVFWIAIMLALFAASVVVIRLLLPAVASATYWVCAGWAGAIAFALCWIGVDYRRWWGLAFLTVVAVAVMLQAEAGPQSPIRPTPRAAILAGVALMLVALPAATGLPVFLT